MRKTILIIVSVLCLFCTMQAQSGLFGRGESGSDNNANPASLNNRNDGLDVILPDEHGTDNDYAAAPLGNGALLLIGFGAAYAMTKKKKKRS